MEYYDLISRQDAKSKKVYSHERHEYVVPVAELDWLPSVQPDVPDTNVGDMVSRTAVIEIFSQLWDCVGEIADKEEWEDVCKTTANELPSAQPENKPIDYSDCANAMLKMWMDNVVTDGEYYKIMDKLNKHELERQNDE